MNTVLMGYHCKLLHVAWLAQGEGNLSGNSIRGEKVLHDSIRLSCWQDFQKKREERKAWKGDKGGGNKKERLIDGVSVDGHSEKNYK